MTRQAFRTQSGKDPKARAQTFLRKEIPSAPVGYEDFWRGTFDQAGGIPLRFSKREIVSPMPGKRLFEFECDSLGGIRIGGWIVEPEHGGWQRGIVVGHGYGGREAPEFELPGPPAVMIFPCIRGFHRSASPDIPGVSDRHVMLGIENRDDYVLRGCVADIWTSASALLSLYPEVGGNLHYIGGSFGGGLGALALAWDARFSRAFFDVPTFGNHPERLKIKSVGSAEPVRQYHLEHPEVVEVLSFFDAAVAAQWVRIPVCVAAALRDQAVPPIGQFGVFKGLAGEKKLFIRRSGHPTLADELEPLHRILNSWFEN